MLTFRFCGSRCSIEPLTCTPSDSASRPTADRATRAAALASAGKQSATHLRRLAEADDGRDVQRARAIAALVSATVDQRLELDASCRT